MRHAWYHPFMIKSIPNTKVEAFPFLSITADTSLSGGSRMFRRGTQVQADYCDSMCCWIVPGRGHGSTL